MKIFTLVACLVLAGCSVVREPEITTVFAFPDETYAVNGAPLTLDALRLTLGDPAQVQVNVAGCYRTGYRAIARLMSSLRNAGYSRIAFATNPSHSNA